MKSMMDTLADALESNLALRGISIMLYERQESLAENTSSIVLIPLTTPQQWGFASDQLVQKRFAYQVNVETSDYYETKRIAREVEETMLSHGFYQDHGGLDDYFKETKRYVDARTYRGCASLYDVEY